ncbi:MAG: hypothetical protein Ct9H300mP11_06790 [Chloroflexota bacterium]|nr:MAG: hypothetical protein Ct9H300mP11_06790 [Chloroflexota bacterium]
MLSRGFEQLGQRVSKINFESEFQGQFGSFGGEDGRFMWPRSIDTDQDGRVYVSDEYLNRISIFDAEGAFRYHFGRTGSEEGELNGPSGIAFDSQNSVWVVDSMNHRIQSFNVIGEFQFGFGRQGIPMGISSFRGEYASTTLTIFMSRTGGITVCRNSPLPGNCW